VDREIREAEQAWRASQQDLDGQFRSARLLLGAGEACEVPGVAFRADAEAIWRS
jgi:hypothetical protein